MTTPIGGPYFDELEIGMAFDSAPALTLTDGLASTHRAIIGDRLRLPLDHLLSQAATGADAPIASPALVWDVAIGQSTLATHHVKANLFYRGLRFHHHARIGDTLRTRAEVVGLRQNADRAGRAPTGLAALRVTCVDQQDRAVLDFYRCAMLPLSSVPDPARTIPDQDLSTIGPSTPPTWTAPDGWDLAPLRRPGTPAANTLVGERFAVSGDVVSSAPELARLTLNIAAVHHDERISGSRLVYGGHTIGIALAQATRAFPDMVTVLGWQSCDHTGPVAEGDTLTSVIEVVDAVPLAQGTALHLRSLVSAQAGSAETRPVLDWRFVALIA